MRCAATTPAAGPDSMIVTGRARRRRRADQAAVRLHHQDRRAHVALGQRAAQPIEVARDQRRDVRVDHRRAGALELEHLGQHVRRQRHVHARQPLAQPRADRALVAGVAIGMEEAHRHRFDPGRLQLVDRRIDVVRIQRRQHAALRIQPLAHAQAHRALDQRLGLLPTEVVGERNADAAQLQHVAKALGRDEPGARAPALENGVGRDRGRVHDFADVAARRAAPRRNTRRCPRRSPASSRPAWTAACAGREARPAARTRDR